MDSYMYLPICQSKSKLLKSSFFNGGSIIFLKLKMLQANQIEQSWIKKFFEKCGKTAFAVA